VRVGQTQTRIADLFVGAISRGKMTDDAARQAQDLIKVSTSIDTLPKGLDLVIDAIPEIAELKRDVLARCEAREPLLLATNTSGLSIDALATALQHPDRFIGMHFFNPVWTMPLVELVIGTNTSDDAREQALALTARIEKEAIQVRDVPGFASTRLGIALGLEAMRMVEDGVASASDIDRAMELGYRHPMGPLRLTDLVGLDVRLDIARNLEAAFGPRYTPPELLVRMVEAGELGKKSGRGFYDWNAGTATPRA
jgi:3-hydroxybutyryl-CoA dehydrogenase